MYAANTRRTVHIDLDMSICLDEDVLATTLGEKCDLLVCEHSIYITESMELWLYNSVSQTFLFCGTLTIFRGTPVRSLLFVPNLWQDRLDLDRSSAVLQLTK